jgi:poly-gamma-glutamate capsule biosynthesis protein CapA/YwtB (metallophosphatase superfamily)
MQESRIQLNGFKPVRADRTRIGVAGDLVFGSNAERALGKVGSTAWGAFKTWARGLDLFIITFDSTFPGPDLKPWEPRVFAGMNCVYSVPLGRRTLFNLANNHAFDGGSMGFAATCRALTSRGIEVVGAGRSREEAERPWSAKMNDQTVNVFAAVHHGCHPRPALPDGGQVAGLDSPTWWQAVQSGVGHESFVLVLLHGGVQGSHYPSPKAIEISNRLMALGVHAVLWSHAHAIQGVVPAGQGFVAYGLGNTMHFPFEGDVARPQANPAYDRGLFLEFEPDPGPIQYAEGILFRREGLRLQPVKVSNAQRRWFSRLCARPRRFYYPAWWRLYRLKRDVIDHSLRYLRRQSVWKQLRRLRPHHIGRLISKIGNARPDAKDV